MILSEMCVFSLIYSYVAVCRFCAVLCLIIICFCLLFSNYWTCVFNILFMLAFCFLFVIFCVFVLLCVLFLLLYIAVSFLFLYKSTNHCHRVETKMQ